MIKIDEVETYGWQAAIRGMRNPKNSWDKSDTTLCCGCDKDCASINNKLCVGNADLKPVSYTHLTLPTTPYV